MKKKFPVVQESIEKQRKEILKRELIEKQQREKEIEVEIKRLQQIEAQNVID